MKLPKTFVPTHQTSGLPGYPAVDCFCPGGEKVLAAEAGIVDRISGRAPTPVAKPGGPYGWSVYIKSPSGRYFDTHFSKLSVKVGQRIAAGALLGTVADYSKATGGKTPSHIHHGKNKTLGAPLPLERYEVLVKGKVVYTSGVKAIAGKVGELLKEHGGLTIRKKV